jgi:hypothetical protein
MIEEEKLVKELNSYADWFVLYREDDTKIIWGLANSRDNIASRWSGIKEISGLIKIEQISLGRLKELFHSLFQEKLTLAH